MMDTTIDQGNSVPAVCQRPDCDVVVHRGIVHICGMDPAAASGVGCGLQFCGAHLRGPGQTCDRCAAGEPPYPTKTEAPEFPEWRLTDPAWSAWREANPELLERTRQAQIARELHKRERKAEREVEKAAQQAQIEPQAAAEVVYDVPPPAPEPEPPKPGKPVTKPGGKKS